MRKLNQIIEELEHEKESDFRQTLSIDGRESIILEGNSMADLFIKCYEQNLEMIMMPQIARARADADLYSETGKILWKYNWMTQSALSRIDFSGRDYAVFSMGNPFSGRGRSDNERLRIRNYGRGLVSGGIPLTTEEVNHMADLRKRKQVTFFPYEKITKSPRGVISITDFLQHVVALCAFGNDQKLVEDYAAKYIKVMKRSPYTALEIGVWFSKDEATNTMRPLEIGDSGIGIYNRNLVNKEYRTIGIKK